MNAWQVEQMVADAAAQEWERINEPDPNEGRYLEAANDLDVAIKHLMKVEDYVEQAADDVEGLPAEDRIVAFIEALGEMRYGLGSLKEKLQRGDV